MAQLRIVRIIVLFTFLAITNSCAQNTPVTSAYDGKWVFTINTNDVGSLKVVMDITTDKTLMDTIYFDACTEKGMDKKVLGSLKAVAGRLAGSNFKNGSLLRIANGKILKNDSITGLLVTPFGNMYINATVRGGRLTGVLNDGLYQMVGSVTGIKGVPHLPLRNYENILDSIMNVTEQKIYDPALLQTSEWKSFKERMQHISHVTGDDAAFVLGFFYYARTLPFSHFYLYPVTKENPAPEAQTEMRFVHIADRGNNTAHMKISSFAGSAAEMDSVFSEIITAGYKNLVIDLRGNPGGALEAGLAFLRHLITDTTYGGIFLTQNYFKNNKLLPQPSAYRNFPRLSESNTNLLIEGISNHQGICLVGYPQPPVFKGDVYVLTDGVTASACEPLVYILKQYGLAKIVGQQTAGAMLTGEPFLIGTDFKLTIPTATYYTSDGYYIDKKGVAPHVVLDKNEDALLYAERMINEKQLKK